MLLNLSHGTDLLYSGSQVLKKPSGVSPFLTSLCLNSCKAISSFDVPFAYIALFARRAFCFSTSFSNFLIANFCLNLAWILVTIFSTWTIFIKSVAFSLLASCPISLTAFNYKTAIMRDSLKYLSSWSLLALSTDCWFKPMAFFMYSVETATAALDLSFDPLAWWIIGPREDKIVLALEQC